MPPSGCCAERISSAAPFRLSVPILRMKLGMSMRGRAGVRCTARRSRSGSGCAASSAVCAIEQRRDIGEFSGQLLVRQAVRGDVAELLHGHTRSFVELRRSRVHPDA